jgi:hypothetical protein
MDPQISVHADMPWQDLLNGLPIVPLVAISLAFVLLFSMAMGGLAVAFVKAVRGGGSTRKLRQMEAQEAKAFHELQRGFTRMMERLESLETLYMGRSQSELIDRESE